MARDHYLRVMLAAFCILVLVSSLDLDGSPVDVVEVGSEGHGEFPLVSGVRSTRASGPDLTLDPPIVIIGESENITFSNENPNEGDTLQINSTVTNNGDENATALVEFYDGPPDESDLIGSETVVVEPGLSVPVSTQWNTTGEEEDHAIFVVVDPEDAVEEANEDNNIVQRDIVVNQRPVADAGEDLLAFVDHPVTLDGGGSLDSPGDMDTLNYTWEYGDGKTGYGEMVEHTYLEEGTFSVTLKVRDAGLALGLDMMSIEVRHLPVEITLTESLEPSICRPGEDVEIAGSIQMEFSSSVLNVEIPLLTVRIDIPETQENWTTRSDANGEYRLHFTAPNSTGTYTLEVSISYGPIQRSSSKTLRVTEAEDVSFFSTGSVFLIVALGAVVGLGAIYGGSELGRYRLLLLVFVPLYTRIKKDRVLDHFHRGRLYNYIELHPGATFTELKKKFAFKNGNLVYHLNFLEKTEFIRSAKEGRHRRFYVKGDFSKSDDLSLYVNEIQKKILSVIAQNPGATQSRIAAILGTSRQKISYNINSLDYAGMIRSVREGSRKIRYYPVEVEVSSGA